MSYFALILSAINIVLFFIFLIKFKSIFSTDSILEKTAKRVDKMIAELNENAQRDLDLLSSSSRKIKKQLDDAEVQMQLFHEATQRLREMLAEVENKKESKVFSVVENKEVHTKKSFQNQISFLKDVDLVVNDGEIVSLINFIPLIKMNIDTIIPIIPSKNALG